MPNHRNFATMKKHLENPDVMFWQKIRSYVFKTVRELEKSMQNDGMSLSRFELLFFLYFDGELAPVELSRRMDVTRANISTFLRRLEKEELITKVTLNDDQKRPLYMLSKKGKLLFESFFPKHIKRVKAAVQKSKSEILNDLNSI